MAVVRKRHVVLAVLALVIAFLFAIPPPGDAKPSVQEYFSSIESRWGYWLLLGNARYGGLWKPGTIWPFPIATAQRAMHEKLYQRLGLREGARVLDAGMGSGYVASYMASVHGLNVQGIDIVPAHVEQARRTVESRGLSDNVAVQEGDYHDLQAFGDASFDGIYTLETFVHADDPEKVLGNFVRLLRPGGVLVMHEVDFNTDSPILQRVLQLSHCQNTLPEGTFEQMLEKAGFKDIAVEDLSEEILPLVRLFWVLASVPYAVLRLLGQEDRFVNIMAGAEGYGHWGDGRYVSIRAVKH